MLKINMFSSNLGNCNIKKKFIWVFRVVQFGLEVGVGVVRWHVGKSACKGR